MENLTDTELRLIALKYAIQMASQSGADVLSLTKEYYKWLKNIN